MHRLIKRASGEQGMVLLIAILVLFVIAILSLVVIQSAVTANSQSKDETNRRIALADANAGLQAALARISDQPFAQGQTYAVASGDCFDTKDEGAVPTTGTYAGYCTGFAKKESLGTLGEYEYDISQGLAEKSGPGCTGFWVNQGTAFASIVQRCITSVGTYNGVTRRVQERVAAENWAFPVNGILSLGKLEFDTSGSQYLSLSGGRYQSNGLMTIGKGKQNIADELKEATLESYGGFSFGEGEKCESPECTKTKASTRFTALEGPGAETYKAAWSSNNDIKLTEGAWKGTKAYEPGAKEPELNANNVGTPSSLKSETEPIPVVMPEGTYIFCNMKINNSAIQTEGKVVIYIDSGASGDGKCGNVGEKPTERNKCRTYGRVGGIEVQRSDFYNPTKIAGELQIYVYGNGPEPVECELENNAPGAIKIENEGNEKEKGKILTTAGELYAPSSYLTTTGEGIWWSGGIVIGSMESNDNDVWGFTGAPPTQAFYPTAWTVCPPARTKAADFGSGCY
jgi:type II secretory pathway pseudopilin PulG